MPQLNPNSCPNLTRVGVQVGVHVWTQFIFNLFWPQLSSQCPHLQRVMWLCMAQGKVNMTVTLVLNFKSTTITWLWQSDNNNSTTTTTTSATTVTSPWCVQSCQKWQYQKLQQCCQWGSCLEPQVHLGIGRGFVTNLQGSETLYPRKTCTCDAGFVGFLKVWKRQEFWKNCDFILIFWYLYIEKVSFSVNKYYFWIS